MKCMVVNKILEFLLGVLEEEEKCQREMVCRQWWVLLALHNEHLPPLMSQTDHCFDAVSHF